MPSNRDETPLLQPRFYLNNDKTERRNSLKFLGLMLNQTTELLKIAKSCCLGPFTSKSLKYPYFACIHCFLNCERIEWTYTHET